MDSDLVKLLAAKIDAANLPKPVFEYKFHDQRKWAFDICWPQYMLAVEVEGGIWTGGRHVNPKGYTADREKYNTAQLFGWTVLSYVDEHIKTAYAINQIKAAFLLLNGNLDDD
ncbi:conserved hypothetical protein [Vibrio chagasii]|nr:conserved hypothetical protein [Vibrio chagasii]